MINIFLNGIWLDVPQQEASLHFANMRFSDVFADPFSTDIELPLTEKNIQALDVWGLHDRSGQLFGSGLACVVTSEIINGDARLQVVSITDTTITATLFMKALPSALNDDFNRVAVDDANTIVDLYNPTMEASGTSAEANFTMYDYGIDPVNGAWYYPNIKLSSLLSRIATATGTTIGTPSTDFRLLATKMTLCPQNPNVNYYMTMPTAGAEQTGTLITNGQHVCIEVLNDGTLKIDRRARAQFTIQVRPTIYVHSTRVYLSYSTNLGLSWTRLASVDVGNSDTSFTATIIAQHDMIFKVSSVPASGYTSSSLNAFVNLNLTGYTITEDDYGIEQTVVNKAIPSWVSGDYTYDYYGVICNLPACSCRELLSNIAWKTGTKISVTGSDITFSSSDKTETINAVIDSTSFENSFFGQRNIFASSDDVTLLMWNIDHSVLESEKVVNKSVFPYINDTTNSNGVMARVPQFAWKVDNNGNAELEVTEFDHLVLVYCASYVLRAFKTVNTLGLRTIERIIEIEGRTTYDIRQADYLYILGHKYMLEEGDIDEQTGITTFKALLV